MLRQWRPDPEATAESQDPAVHWCLSGTGLCAAPSPHLYPWKRDKPKDRERRGVKRASLIARVKAMGLSNIQIFALSLPGAFVIIPNRVDRAHLQRKDRHVAVWVSGAAVLAKRLRDPIAPANQLPTPKAPTSHRTGEGRRPHYWKQPVCGAQLAWQSLQPKGSPPSALRTWLAEEKPETQP